MRRFRDIWQSVRGNDLSRFNTVMADHAHESVSSRYSFIPTTAPVKVMAELGWFPTAIAERRTRKEGFNGFQTHAVKFRNDQTNRQIEVHETVPELILFNQHAAGAAFRLILGLFEKVCTNGLMVERASLADQHVRHIGYTPEKVAAAIATITPMAGDTLSSVNDFRKLTLKPLERKALAAAASELRWDSTEYQVNQDHLLTARHHEQREPTLWNTFNVLQENMIKGGPRVRNIETGKTSHARQVSGLGENERLNRALWRLQEEFFKLKQQ